MSRVFVTGGSGFLGRNLIPALGRQGTVVRALARSDAALAVVERLGAEGVRGDLDDGAALRAGMEGCDVLFHHAARTNDWGRYEDPYREDGLAQMTQAASSDSGAAAGPAE